MPTWDIACAADCGHTDSLTCRFADRDAMMPQHCGKPMEVDFSSYRQSTTVFESYTTTNIHPEGKPIKVLNSAHLRALETEYGVKRCDDPSLVARGGELVHERQHGKRTYI